MSKSVKSAVDSFTPGLVASEIQTSDIETERMRSQIEAEAALAQNVRPMQITIPRRAAAALAAEAERCVSRGIYPSAEALIGAAVERAYGGLP